MLRFEYYAPTRVIFGEDAERKTGALIKREGGKKALVHYGGGSAVRFGLLDRIYASLEQAGVEYVSLGGVVPNPVLSKVYEGIELCRREQVDFILAVGGGSVIDSAKAIGLGLSNDCDVWELYGGEARPKGCMPVGAVLTIAAAGSEMSDSSVITKEEGQLKRACSSDFLRCRFAVMNPELTRTLPPYQTASGCVDMMMHTMERYFTREATLEVTDGVAESLLRTVMHNARILKKDPENGQARTEIMWAGSLCHNGLTGCGTSDGDWACHALEHELSGLFNVTHGAGLAAVWGSWARYVYRSRPERFAQFGVRVMGVRPVSEDTEAAALAGIAAAERFFHSIGMPVSIPELGLDPTQEQIREMARKCSGGGKGTIGVFQVLHEKDMQRIYEMAVGRTRD